MASADEIPGLLSRFCKVEEREVLGAHQAFFNQQRPIDEALPKGLPHQDDRDVARFAGLEKGQ